MPLLALFGFFITGIYLDAGEQKMRVYLFRQYSAWAPMIILLIIFLLRWRAGRGAVYPIWLMYLLHLFPLAYVIHQFYLCIISSYVQSGPGLFLITAALLNMMMYQIGFKRKSELNEDKV